MSMLLANLFILVEELWLGGDVNQIAFAFGILLDSVASCMLLQAGYAHNFIGAAAAAGTKASAEASSVDIVVYAAGLVSNRAAIEKILDTVRSVTAQLNPELKMSDGDQRRLRETYLALEDYLTTQEPAQRFTRANLRELVSSTLHLDVRPGATFWPDCRRHNG